MSGQPLGAAWTTCGHCGLPLKSRQAVCKSCGSIVPIERVQTRLKAAFRQRTSGPDHALDQTKLTLWFLAAVPLLVAPPLLAIAIVWRRRLVARDIDPTFLTIVAIGNVIFSLIVLLKFRSEALAFLAWASTTAPSAHQTPAGHSGLTPI